MRRAIVGVLCAISLLTLSYAQTTPLGNERAPKIDLIQAPPQVTLGQEFPVTVKVADEAGVDQVEIKFNGKTQTMSGQGSKELLLTFILKADQPGEHTVEAMAIDLKKVRSRTAMMVISVKAESGPAPAVPLS